MNRIANDLCRLVTVELSQAFDCGYNEEEIDWLAVNERIGDALRGANVPIQDLCVFLGVDPAAGDVMDQIARLPRLKSAISVSAFLGVPVAWLLTGKGNDPFAQAAPAAQMVSDTHSSTVVQGNSAGTMIIQGSAPMSEQKRELLRIFDGLPLRRQIELLAMAYKFEDGQNVS